MKRLMKRLLPILTILGLLPISAIAGHAQNTTTIQGSGAPAGSCSFVLFYIDSATGNFYNCKAGSWNLVGGSASPVTSVTGTANQITVTGTTTPTISFATNPVVPSPANVCSSTPTTVHVGPSNFTSTSASQTAITGLAFTLPASTACNYVYHCNLVVSEASSATALTFSVNDVTTAPTNMIGWGRMATSVTADTTRSFSAVSTTGSNTIIQATPGAAGTNLSVTLDGFIEQPSGAASVFQIELGVGGGANTTTINRGSKCEIHRE